MSIITLRISTHCRYILSLFIYDCHPVKIVLRQIQMLTRIIFHRLIMIVILRQLLNFKTRWFRTAYLCSLSSLISILIILIMNCAIGFLLTVNCIILTYIYCIWIITFGLSLSWMNHSPTLHLSFLPGTSSSTSHTCDCITSTIVTLCLWIEILSSSWKSWQYVLIIIFQWFVYFWYSLICTGCLKMVHNSLMSISSWSLTTYLSLSL